MLKAKLLVTSILFITLHNCVAQGQPVVQRKDLIFKITPTSLFDPELPTLELGVNYFVTERFGIQAKFGPEFTLDNLKIYDGYRVMGEFQYKPFERIYFSLEGGYSQNKDDGAIGYVTSTNPDEPVRDEFWSMTYKKFLVPKVGFILVSRGHFWLNIFAGIGVKHTLKNVYDLEFDPSNGDQELTDEGDDSFPFSTISALSENGDEEKDEFTAKLSFGLDLGYKLRLSK